MTKEEIISGLNEYIAKEILKKPGRKLEPDAALISSGVVDSFSLVDLALFIEDTYDVRLEDTELNAQTFDSLTQLADLILSRK